MHPITTSPLWPLTITFIQMPWFVPYCSLIGWYDPRRSQQGLVALLWARKDHIHHYQTPNRALLPKMDIRNQDQTADRTLLSSDIGRPEATRGHYESTNRTWLFCDSLGGFDTTSRTLLICDSLAGPETTIIAPGGSYWSVIVHSKARDHHQSTYHSTSRTLQRPPAEPQQDLANLW